jgi:hypothetical protein
MKRITTVLGESEAMAVRKAVCMAGCESVVIAPIPFWMCGVDMVDMIDIYSEKRMAEWDKQVRLDVTSNNSQYGRIVSAIRRIVPAGKIVLASWHDSLPKGNA